MCHKKTVLSHKVYRQKESIPSVISYRKNITQLPFFITTCDYTLMGEELYAASAYLSREPRLLGSLKGQDIGKGVILLVLVAGTLLAGFDIPILTQIFTSY